MTFFRKKPVVVSAVQWDGENTRDVVLFVNPDAKPFAMPKGWWLKQLQDDGPPYDFRLMVPTLEGETAASPNDWIIRGVAGEFYPCKPEIFAATYEEV